MTVFQFYIFVIIVGGAIFGVFYFSNHRRKLKEIYLSLGFVLYEVTMPQEKVDGGSEKEKDLIAVMEQFYDGMMALESYFSLEIGLPANGHELVFYVAVEKKQSQLFEKQIQGLFPYANLVAQKDDYNIFKPKGVSVGSFAKLKKSEFLPLKTYDQFKSDPLQLIINVFSKLQREGEGAALQIIVSPLDEKKEISARAKAIANEVRKGKSFGEALQPYESVGMGVGKGFFELLFGGKNKSQQKQEEDTSFGQRTINETLVNALDLKASKMTMGTNIRLLASSNDKNKAEVILSELESAFLQFAVPHGNKLDFTRVAKRQLKDFFYKFSFRVPDDEKITKLNTAELATLFHFPTGIESSEAPQLKHQTTRETPPPLNLPAEGVLLGRNVYRGEISEVRMKENDRRRHFYVIGQTGTGKSVLLKNMIVQDIEEGKGVCFIDPHGSDVQDILSCIPPERVEDVIYFNPGDTSRPMGLNMLEYDVNYPEQKSFIVNELLGIFNKLFDMKASGGPMFEQYFRNAAMLVMDSPELGNTLLELGRVMSDADFRNRKLEACDNPLVVSFWKETAEKAGGEASLQNMVPYITSKFDTFLSNEIMRPIITQEKSALNFREIMDDKKILLVNLSKGRLGDLNSSLIGLIIVGKILMASLSRVDIPEEQRKDFYLYIDEFQNVTTDSISTILSEARKYKLNLIIAHQFIGQLEEGIKKAVFGNAGSVAAFRVGAEDGEFLEKQFEPVFKSHDLINIDNYNAYLKLLVGGQITRPFPVQTIPFKKGDTTLGEEIAKLSSFKYGKPRAEIEEGIKKKYQG